MTRGCEAGLEVLPEIASQAVQIHIIMQMREDIREKGHKGEIAYSGGGFMPL